MTTPTFSCPICRQPYWIAGLDTAADDRAFDAWAGCCRDEATEDEVFDDWTRDLGALALLGGMAAAYIGFVRDAARGWIGAIRGT